MDENLEAIVPQALDVLTTYGLSVVGAIVILIVGLIIAGQAKRITERALNRIDKFDGMLAGFLASMVRYGIIAITVIAVLERFGVQTTSLVAVLGAAGLAVGLALQGTLSNVAAGVMLLIFRPFKTGDFVEVAGEKGTVKGITLFVTELATPDNVQIIVPNGDVWGSSVKNYSFHDLRRVDLVVGVGYDDDLEKAKNVLMDVISSDTRSLSDPEPFVALTELGASSVDFTLRVWCKNADYWALKFDLTRAIKDRLDKEGLSIPYPQTDVHLFGSAAA